MTDSYQQWEIKAHMGINGVYVSHVRRPKKRWIAHRDAPTFVREYLTLDVAGKIDGSVPNLAAFERIDGVTALFKVTKGPAYDHRYAVNVWLPPSLRMPRTPPFALARISQDYENFAELGHAVYKYTDCGPWITAVLISGAEVYYDSREARDLSINTMVKAVKVGSIVEGSDAEIGPYEVRRAKDFWPTVKLVNDEAVVEWNEANREDDEMGRLGLDSEL